jgi:L-threonylcarbamoyladenylate synthase
MSLITTDIALAIYHLQSGKPVAIPTETVYGLAAPINNETAIKAVYAMKERPLNHPLIIHVAPFWDISSLVTHIPDYAKKLMAHFWPGPLTLVLPCHAKQINPLINGGQRSVAIRCPAHPIAQDLLNQLQIPVVAPSANPFGKISPTTALHVQESFPEENLIILDGGRCRVGIESTIIDATHPETYQILRHGLIEEEAIAQVTAALGLNHPNSIRVPGKLDSHYQPQKTLYYFEKYEKLALFCKKNPHQVYAIAHHQPPNVTNNHFYPFAEQPEQAAYDLYYQLRQADASNAQCIAIELPPAVGLWQGIRERLLKAGVPHFQNED